jgi:MgsA AAA+ ATPase C terminal
VNGPEVFHLIRHDLQAAVARQGKPPTPQARDASPWLAMSALQKAIRRGREDVALGAAATLLRDAPEKLWRRIGCIAYEDVGLASVEAVGLATVALEGKRHRATLGGEWAVASCVVAELSRASKCRAADDLLMACELHPAYAETRAELPYLTTRDLITVATRQRSVHERALALRYALGTDRRPSGLVSRRGEPRLVFDRLCEAGWPHSIVEVAREGFRRTGEMLCPLVALLSVEPRQVTQLESDDLPPEEMIGDIPTWAIDLYSREGRAALARFLQTDAPAAQWVRRNVSQARRVSFLGHIVFRVEGGLVVNRLRWPLADELRRQVDFECSGPNCADAAEILELMRADLPLLNKARATVAGRLRHAF